MENKKQTAVDLFLGEIIPLTINCVPSIDLFECWKRAKKMEKEQIIGSYLQGRMKNHNLPMSMDYMNLLDDAEGESLKHYKETYGE